MANKMIEPKPVPWNKILLFAGIFLILLGIIHVPIQFLNPRDWESPIGWRKPILFGISTGITLVSLAWVVSQTLEKQRLIAWLLSSLAVVEVFIITVQTWREVPAHFNNGEFFDKFLANSIDAMLIVITLSIFYLTFVCFTKKFAIEDEDYGFSMRWGMLFLAISCVFGFGVAIYGNAMLESGNSPEVIAPNGVPKFVHGIALHALQVFPFWVFVMRKIGIKLENRLKSLRFSSITFFLVTFYALWQTLNGFGRFEINFGGIIILICVVISGFIALFYIIPIRKMKDET